MSYFPRLDDFTLTLTTLHAYVRIVGALGRAFAAPQPGWGHVAFGVRPEGWVTARLIGIALREVQAPWIRIAIGDEAQAVLLESASGELGRWSLLDGMTARQLGLSLLESLRQLGVDGDLNPDRLADDDPRLYDSGAARAYHGLLLALQDIFNRQRDSLPGEKSPVRLWPHNFDMAFEWFGSRLVEYKEGEHSAFAPAQLSLGFSPGDQGYRDAYIYSNPWPFETRRLLEKPLPVGARWHTQGWQGSLLPYSALLGDPHPQERILEFARAVYEISRPTLEVK